MTINDYVGIATLLAALLAAALGAFYASRKVRDKEAEEPYRSKPLTIALREEDAGRVDGLADALRDLRKAIADHAEIVAKHRHAVGDNTAERQRGRD